VIKPASSLEFNKREAQARPTNVARTLGSNILDFISCEKILEIEKRGLLIRIFRERVI
jgi:hypothetical protein